MKASLSHTAKGHSKAFYFGEIWLVILVWSIAPVVTPFVYEYFSPTLTTTLTGLLASLSLLPIVWKHFSKMTKGLLAVAIPTGILNGVANLLQKIGLLYTTPSKYAFLENLSCVVVPILMYLFVRKKPGALKILAALLCIAGCFILSGGRLGEWSAFGAGEILCALAGILYGVNIAATGAFSDRIYAPLYVFIHMIIQTVTSLISLFALHFIHFDGAPISPFYFEWNPICLLWVVAMAVLSNTLCWLMRTNALKHLDPSVVAVMMPFSAVITGILSVITGQDTVSTFLVIGGVLVLVSSILSELGDTRSDKKEAKEKNENG